jgi:hypothetical protein
MKKLIDDTIGINTKDLEIFLELLSAYGNYTLNPYLVDAAQSLKDQLSDSELGLKSDFEAWSNGQIKFK